MALGGSLQHEPQWTVPVCVSLYVSYAELEW